MGTITYITDILEKVRIPPLAINEFLSLLRTCLNPNICKFKNEIFSFPDGSPMGFPISSLIAEFLIDKLENEIFNFQNSLAVHIDYWFRYIDDILCLRTGSVHLLNYFLSYINSLYPSIKFTLEIGGSQINFLDLMIHNKHSLHNFKIFRKPISTDITIHDSSFHTPSHKHAAFSYS